MKKILCPMLSVMLIFSLCLTSSAYGIIGGFLDEKAEGGALFGSPEAAAPQAQEKFTDIQNISLTFFISSSGKATISYAVLARKGAGIITIKAYIERRTLGVFWRRVDIGNTDNEWSLTTSKSYSIDSYSTNLKDYGDYRATLEINSGGDRVVKTAEFSYEKGVVMGDVNGDGILTAADARMILRYSARLESFTAAQQKLSDLNCDGEITAFDARIALRASANLF